MGPFCGACRLDETGILRVDMWRPSLLMTTGAG